jgi:hypothetical protein
VPKQKLCEHIRDLTANHNFALKEQIEGFSRTMKPTCQSVDRQSLLIPIEPADQLRTYTIEVDRPTMLFFVEWNRSRIQGETYR